MKKQYTLSIFTENNPGVLQRITILFTKRKVNIDSLTVSETERHGFSRFTIVVRVDELLIQKIAKQIQRVIEVLHVDVFEDSDLFYKEIAFIRVDTPTDEIRKEVEAFAEDNRISIVLTDESSIALEVVGSEESTNRLLARLRHLRISEFVRSGRIAIPRKGTTHEEAVRLAV